MPVNASSWKALGEPFKAQYREYLQKLTVNYTHIKLQAEFKQQPNKDFNDSIHLTQSAAIRFTRGLAKYAHTLIATGNKGNDKRLLN
jgi:hypothetical protein